jgi:alpha-amylase/alpha-mannosidase (GH57 family)
MRHLALIICCLLTVAVISSAGDLYLNIIWHQHQPLYVNPETDQLTGPWVRTHATKDYYDMAAMLKNFPEIHATINLTSSLLYQLQTYYVDRVVPFIYVHEDGKRAIDTTSYFSMWRGKTDPWIDLALIPSSNFTQADIDKLVNEPWNAFGISRVQIARFPEYDALQSKPRDQLTLEDYTAIKAWFYLAHFDPSFLNGTAQIPVDMRDLLEARDGRYYLRHPLTERDANRLVADAVYVCGQVVPAHQWGALNETTLAGSFVEIITTPFYHPILPLLIDTDIARVCQPNDELPARFAFQADANAQVVKGSNYYRVTFGFSPQGMWPAEGSISEAAADVFAANGIQWICGDMHVLERSLPAGLNIAEPYRLKTPSGDIMIVFRETNLSDRIGFTYQRMQPAEAANDFLAEVLRFKPTADEPDRLLTVILDGENAWEWYEYDMDAKQFLKLMYENLTTATTDGNLKCVTPSEYIQGNSNRSIPPHPVSAMQEITKLWPGSWINANYDTWIGEKEENTAWDYLRQTRHHLAESGLIQPNPSSPRPTEEKARAAWDAYESIYAAEGSDWFWWYGADQTAGAGDKPFEDAFFSHLRAVYRHANDAGANLTVPEFAPILSASKVELQESGGVMARSEILRTVRFICEATERDVPEAIYIVGNLPALGNWTPNTIRLFDDGTHGDTAAKDGIWTIELKFPVGSEIQYKYTNSGEPGIWQPSEEFAQSNRAFTVEDGTDTLIRHDEFGIRD